MQSNPKDSKIVVVSFKFYLLIAEGAKAVDKLTVVIPTLQAAEEIKSTLSALGPDTRLIVVDSGSTDGTVEHAREYGATILSSPPGRGTQLAAGALAAGKGWLLFLHADTLLTPDWRKVVAHFISIPGAQGKSAVFKYHLEDTGLFPRFLEFVVRLRFIFLSLPYGDQGLLIHSSLYQSIGGYRSIPLMEDVDIVRRLGRRRIVLLNTVARTSAIRYQRNGYLNQILRNFACLSLYIVGAPMNWIVWLYDL